MPKPTPAPVAAQQVDADRNPQAGGSYLRTEAGELQLVERTEPARLQPATLPMSREQAQAAAAALEGQPLALANNTPTEL